MTNRETCLANLSQPFLLALAAIVESRQAGAEQYHSSWLWHGVRSSREAEDYAVIPEVTIRIEPKSDVASIQEVGTQHSQLIRGERVNEISRRCRERLLGQKSICRSYIDQRIVQIALTRKVVVDVGYWSLIRRSILERVDARVPRRIEQVNEERVWVAIPIADVTKRQGRARNAPVAEIHSANSPCVSIVMIQIKLPCPAAASIRRGYGCLKRYGVG